MTLPHILVIVSLCISTYATSAYIRDTLAGKTKPNRAAWALWGLAPLSGAYVGWAAGVDPWALVGVFSSGFFPFLICLASFVNPHSYWKLGRFDYACAALSLFALSCWFVASSSALAIILLVIQDAAATVLIVKKAWRHPETETGSTFILALVSSALTFPVLVVWNIETLAFPIYFFCANCVLIFTIYRRHIISLLKAHVSFHS